MPLQGEDERQHANDGDGGIIGIGNESGGAAGHRTVFQVSRHFREIGTHADEDACDSSGASGDGGSSQGGAANEQAEDDKSEGEAQSGGGAGKIIRRSKTLAGDIDQAQHTQPGNDQTRG